MATKKTTSTTSKSRTRQLASDAKEPPAQGRRPRAAQDSGADNSGEPSASKRIDVGDRFPDATLEDQTGAPFRLASLRGKPAVVYFYPKDDTPGCTREACGFQSELARLSKLGARVVGISPDSAARHAKFAEKYALEFTLLVDAERAFAKTCAVLVPKTLYGKTSIGIERSTFLLDASGVIRRVWRKVKVDGHVDHVLEALRELRKN